MSQQVFFDPIPLHRLECFSKSDLIILFKGEQGIRKQLEKDNKRLRELNRECKQKRLGVDDDYIVLKNKFFGKSSEKQAKPEVPEKKRSSEKSGKKRVLLPSLRYPDTALIERDVELEKLPHCGCCGHEMRDTGLTENSEHLTVIPSQYMVIRQKRHKYSCGKCYGSMVTAPSPPKVKPGGGYSDEMMIDVSVSKYCDLIPIERYVRMASRLGISDIPPQSLIEQTHSLGKFIEPVYKRLKEGILSSKVLHADETTHRMLEGSKKSNWYLWGFSTPRDSYFDIRDSRSGSVASEFLLKSQCEYLVSDVFSGYAKAVREVNRDRVRQNRMMDKVFENERGIKEKIAGKTLSFFKQKIDVTFFDVTTLYFESFIPDELRKSGYSKDNKVKETQVVLALMTTGLPQKYWRALMSNIVNFPIPHWATIAKRRMSSFFVIPNLNIFKNQGLKLLLV